jgi:hypothetical protein
MKKVNGVDLADVVRETQNTIEKERIAAKQRVSAAVRTLLAEIERDKEHLASVQKGAKASMDFLNKQIEKSRQVWDNELRLAETALHAKTRRLIAIQNGDWKMIEDVEAKASADTADFVVIGPVDVNDVDLAQTLRNFSNRFANR